MTTTATETGEAVRERAGFAEKYRGAVERNHSLLCVGLDPDPGLMPEGVSTFEFLMRVVEATSDLVCCYKPNAAFFEREGDEGWRILRDLIRAIPDDIPVLLDAKRGDVGNTAKAYAEAVYGWLDADAVTLSPYLGFDAIEPFLQYPGRHAFVLCRTSNPGARDFQDLLAGDVRLYERVAEVTREWNAEGPSAGRIGLVVGATYPEEAARVRAICPDQLILMPGVGAQAGDLEASVRAGVDAQGGSILVNASRSVLYAGAAADARTPQGWADAARAEAERLRAAIEAARGPSD